jgi:hypothetical protein
MIHLKKGMFTFFRVYRSESAKMMKSNPTPGPAPFFGADSSRGGSEKVCKCM